MATNKKYKIFAKSVLLLLTCLILCYLLNAHLVATHQDTAVIWVYKAHTVLDYSIYFGICLVAFILSSLLFRINKKVLIIEGVVYFIIALIFCLFGDNILSSIHFDWPMNYTPRPI